MMSPREVHQFELDNQVIGTDADRVYVVAELSANHGGSIENTMALIAAAKEAGASAVKLQTYTPDTITLNCERDEFFIRNGPWAGRTLYDLYSEGCLPWHWHEPLFEFARDIGVTLFSSPFDETAIDLLEKCNCPAYKIASFELVDHGLIARAASTGKPLIMSTGMAFLEEIDEAVTVAQKEGAKDIVLLKCVSGYPAEPKSFDLNGLQILKEMFGLPVGLSDHTLSNTVAIASVALGAVFVEKHFTLDRSTGGLDSKFSITPQELKSLVTELGLARDATQGSSFGPKDDEVTSLNYRRSLYFVRHISKGDKITTRDLKSVRPSNGLPPKYFTEVVGATATSDIPANTPVSWALITKCI